jgi:hypothetical protein
MDEPLKHHCNRCDGETTHHIRGEHQRSGAVPINDPETGDEIDEINWWERFEIVQCAGCDRLSFRTVASNDADHEISIRLFPPKASRTQPNWLGKVPVEMRTLLRQTYQALDGDSRALAMMGARAVADMLLVAKVGDVGGFEQKLDRMVAGGHLSAPNREILEPALDAGNAAAHRGHQPTVDDVDAVMDILENLLQATYHLEPLAAALKKSTPPRPPRPSKP